MSEPLDCGDNSCEYATRKGGMRTNGGCRCELTLNVNRANEMTVEMHQLRRALARHGLVIARRAPPEPVAVTEARALLQSVAHGGRPVEAVLAWLQRHPEPGPSGEGT